MRKENAARYVTQLLHESFGSTQRSSLLLPPAALDALDVEAGAELEIEIVGRTLVIRSVKEARRSGQFMNAFDTVLSKRRCAYDALDSLD